MEKAEWDSFGFSPAGYNQIVLFREEQAFRNVLKANPCMEAIVGADERTRAEYPGIYIAGIKAN